MDHSFYQDRISAFFDNELPSQERELLTRHLEECPDCQKMLARLGTLDVYAEQHSGLVQTDYWERSARVIEERLGAVNGVPVSDVRRGWWKGWYVKAAAVAASIAVLAFVALYEGKIRKQIELEAPRLPGPKEARPKAAFDSSGGMSAEIGKDQKKAQEGLPTVQMPSGQDIDDKSFATTSAGDQLEPAPAAGTGKAEDTAEPVSDVESLSLPGDDSISPMLESSAPAVELAPPDSVATVNLKKASKVADQFPLLSEEQAAREYPEMAKIQTDTLSLSQEVVVERVMPPTLPEDWLLPSSVEVWRRRRDSLLSLYVQTTSTRKTEFEAKGRRVTGGPPREHVEFLLLHASYQLCRLTSDTSERTEALDFLNRMAADTTRPLSREARMYLDTLTSRLK
ncbi:MAG TPA: zf-HC2 domain-containing protein [Candidatus Deferrimicrobium sp.]|nr:zf-HC2 domain-containing protein [Candidatus Deferrimicrobium sp.]